MIRSRFLWRLWAGYAAIILAAALVVGALVDRRVELRTLDDLDARLEAEARLLAELARPCLEPAAEAAAEACLALEARIVRLGPKLGVRFTVVRSDGTVAADSEGHPDRMDNHGERPEIVAARFAGVGRVSRFSTTVERRLRYLAVSTPAGFVRAAVSLELLEHRLAELRRLVALGTGAAAGVALVLGLWMTGRINGPIRTLTAAADAIAAGDYAARVEVDSDDELGRLARAFNAMSGELETSLAAIRADREKLAAVLSSLVEGVVAVDTAERIVHLNQVAGRLFDVEPATALGRPIWEVTRFPEVQAALEEAIAGRVFVSRELRRRGGPEQVLALRATPLRGAEAGELAGAVLVLEDVTPLRRLETMRADFVANASHELKTPLTAVRAVVETLCDDAEMPAETRRRFLDKIRAQTERMTRLVSDLLSLARLEAAPGGGERAWIDLREPVGDAVRALGPAAEAKGVRLVCSLPEEPTPVLGDEESLQQAVSNLLDNAIKYSPENETVTVRLERQNGRVAILVADRGIGIAPADQERIFERFYRVDKARSRALGGTGLGLSIVKHIALAHGGRVTVESRLGQGSSFRVELPAAARLAASAGAGEAP